MNRGRLHELLDRLPDIGDPALYQPASGYALRSILEALLATDDAPEPAKAPLHFGLSAEAMAAGREPAITATEVSPEVRARLNLPPLRTYEQGYRDGFSKGRALERANGGAVQESEEAVMRPAEVEAAIGQVILRTEDDVQPDIGTLLDYLADVERQRDEAVRQNELRRAVIREDDEHLQAIVARAEAAEKQRDAALSVLRKCGLHLPRCIGAPCRCGLSAALEDDHDR